MALGKVTQDKIISESLKKEFGDKFTFEAPILYFETDENVFFLSIETSNLGRTSITRPKITFKQIENVVNPILDKHNIIYSKWSSGLQNPKTWKEDVSYLHTDSEEELSQALKKIIPYIRDYCIPFWEKYKDLNSVVELVNKTQELHTVFDGEVDFEVITLLWMTKSDLYLKKKQDFIKNQQDLASYSSEYSAFPIAFAELIELLESSTNKLV
ncbi:hypothetical protein [Croceivirga radicis]|uniref:hypothetical protein n=1 Tax=Croceivirga radicis TaxID=1929488 RepID=UPI000255AC15|nr:hypothetical protein [Croceivirga radicis]